MVLRREARALKERVADLTLENHILLENHFLPGDLEAQIEAFVQHFNHQRYHESLNNVTPAAALVYIRRLARYASDSRRA